ncbi:YecA family protein [Erwinia sp. Eh17-17]|jgi:uncharacterized protein|uniref:YecA/YgfB family protein n=1 Tax=Erwinia sp. Eh17-17 TaxID=3080330 RepID=UPI00320B424C
MQQGPLTEEELEFLDDVLLKYGSDESVVDASELDGLFTAILSGPVLVEPQNWLPVIWGGEENDPEWESDEEFEQFMDLIAQHMNDIADRLEGYPDQFEPLFGLNSVEGQEFTVVEDWCCGYMKGVALSDWSSLPVALQPALAVIALHGEEENLSRLEKLSPEEYEQSIEAIRPAAISLHAKWLLH